MYFASPFKVEEESIPCGIRSSGLRYLADLLSQNDPHSYGPSFGSSNTLFSGFLAYHGEQADSGVLKRRTTNQGCLFWPTEHSQPAYWFIGSGSPQFSKVEHLRPLPAIPEPSPPFTLFNHSEDLRMPEGGVQPICLIGDPGEGKTVMQFFIAEYLMQEHYPAFWGMCAVTGKQPTKLQMDQVSAVVAPTDSGLTSTALPLRFSSIAPLRHRPSP